MKIILFFALVVTNLVAFSVQAQANTCCYCETGTFPNNEKKFFKMGCQMWLNDQKNCSAKTIVGHGYNYVGESQCQNFNIGYVGHWADSYQTTYYLDQTILPLTRYPNSTVNIENTACRAMLDPYQVQNYMNQQSLPKNFKITFNGNQVNSVGKWDNILGGSYNLNATLKTNSAKKSELTFPACRHFLNKNCLEKYQAQESGLCMDQNQKLKKIVCCKDSTATVGEGIPVHRFAWQESQNCN